MKRLGVVRPSEGSLLPPMNDDDNNGGLSFLSLVTNEEET